MFSGNMRLSKLISCFRKTLILRNLQSFIRTMYIINCTTSPVQSLLPLHFPAFQTCLNYQLDSAFRKRNIQHCRPIYIHIYIIYSRQLHLTHSDIPWTRSTKDRKKPRVRFQCFIHSLLLHHRNGVVHNTWIFALRGQEPERITKDIPFIRTTFFLWLRCSRPF